MSTMMLLHCWESLRWSRRTICIAVLAALLAGCSSEADSSADPPASDATPTPAAAVRLMVVDDPNIAATIARRSGEWQARTGGGIEVVETTSGDLLSSETIDADAVIYPSHYLGELAERKLIAPVRSQFFQADSYHASDIFELVRHREIQWGEQPLGMPLGSPTFVLYYRTDLLEKLGVKPPKTWAEYIRLARRLADRTKLGSAAPPEDQSWMAAVEPLASGWASRVLLARAAAYAQHRSHYSVLWNIDTMEPLVGGPPFVRALEELVTTARLSKTERLDPAAARQAIHSGRAALALSWPTAADKTAYDSPPVPIGFAEIPGAEQSYNVGTQTWDDAELRRVPLLGIAGRVGSLVAESKNATTAMQLLTWLSGPEISVQVSPKSAQTTLFRHSQVAAPTLWVESRLDAPAAKQYGETVEAALDAETVFLVPRIPGADEYLAALDEAVAAALSGTPAQEALSAAAERWDAITESHGRQSQRAAYSRSLGLMP